MEINNPKAEVVAVEKDLPHHQFVRKFSAVNIVSPQKGLLPIFSNVPLSKYRFVSLKYDHNCRRRFCAFRDADLLIFLCKASLYENNYGHVLFGVSETPCSCRIFLHGMQNVINYSRRRLFFMHVGSYL